MMTKSLLSISEWKKAMLRSMYHLMMMINHRSSHTSSVTSTLVSEHLSLIDCVLKLVDAPILYNHLDGKSSNVETLLMNVVIDFLVNMINEPSILAHIKQARMAERFLRLTSCGDEQLVLNVHTLLAYTTHEEDIAAMPNAGQLLSIIVESLKKHTESNT